ncbi:hypothetical protein AB0395_45180 [Streptosporangium sp. NPDC051023]|uniref:hypothetical protein n=1 Tax=Streptosporangium sp. NPDC051023 TaxID=3155410 RepID=UPI00344F117D
MTLIKRLAVAAAVAVFAAPLAALPAAADPLRKYVCADGGWLDGTNLILEGFRCTGPPNAPGPASVTITGSQRTYVLRIVVFDGSNLMGRK